MSTIPETQKPNDTPPSSNQQTLMQMINGYWNSQMICVAAKLGIADLVADGPKSSAELARTTGTHAPTLYRLLRALASLGVFVEDDQGRFGLTPLAEPLRTGVPDSLHDWVVFAAGVEAWRSWEQLSYSVTTGEAAFEHVWGMPNWDYRAQKPEANAIFNAAMISVSSRRIGPVMGAYDFSGIRTLVDVGGGHGAFIAAILSAYPMMRGILFDLPHVIAGAELVLQAAGIAGRCETIGGSFLEAAPGGGDAYLLSKVIHDWGDDLAAVILRNCRQVMTVHSRLLLVEAVIPPGNTPHPGKLADINMLIANSGGRERTEAEFRALFHA
ncbi:MAG: methyltransferase, partial [Chloroflexota bacterium]